MSKKQRVSSQCSRVFTPYILSAIVRCLPFKERWRARRVSRFWKQTIDTRGVTDARTLTDIKEELLWLYNHPIYNPEEDIMLRLLTAVQGYMEDICMYQLDMMKQASPPATLVFAEHHSGQLPPWVEGDEIGINAIGGWTFLFCSISGHIICYHYDLGQEIELSDEWSRWALASALNYEK